MNDFFMKRALVLAKKGLGLTSPNPCVGAVIVKGGKIIAEGWHKLAGEDHAEVVAIKQVMKKSGIVTRDFEPTLFHNAELYVTLEPCCHVGKTPACTNIIKLANFKKVYVGMLDPNKKMNGKSIKYLKNHNIDVEKVQVRSTLYNDIRDLNQPFIKWITHELPYVTLKAGMSLDGKIATSTGESKWITFEKARKQARTIRSSYDAVLVGSGTVKSDDPELAPIGKFKKKNLLRIIIDKKLTLPIKSKVFRDENVFVACTQLASKKNKEKFKKKGIKFRSFGKKEVSIPALLKYLAKRNILSVFVEGGSKIHGSFYDAALKNNLIIDKVLFYVSPKLIGGSDSLPVIAGQGVKSLKDSMIISHTQIEKVGNDFKIEGCLNKY